MKSTPVTVNGSSGAGTAVPLDLAGADPLRDISTAVRRLNNLQAGQKEFTVAWNSEGRRYVVLVSDKNTGALVDQIPAENIVKVLLQVVAEQKKLEGDLTA